MGWIRISDDFYDNAKLADAGAIGVAVWIAGLGYCNRNLTDGVIPRQKALGLVDTSGVMMVEGGDVAEQAVIRLLDYGLWHEEGHSCPDCVDPGPRRYVIHDYLKFQPSRSDVEAKREAEKERIAAWRASRKQGKSNSTNGVRNAVTHTVSNDSCNSVGKMVPNPTPNPNSSSNEEECSKRAKPRRRGVPHPIPDDWEPNDVHRAKLAKLPPGVDLDHEAEQFRNHAQAHGRELVSWDAGFHQWLGRAKPRPASGRSTTDDRVAQALRLATPPSGPGRRELA